jgi:opacity protein-like surface antigen
MMKRLLVAAAAVLWFCQLSRAQDEISDTKTIHQNAAAGFSETSASGEALLQTSHSWTLAQSLNQVAGTSLASADRLFSSFLSDRPADFSSAIAMSLRAEPEPARPAAPPSFVFGGRDDFRFQLALGLSFVRFRSSRYFASAVGTATSLTYFTNEWFAFEGNINTAFAPTINVNEHVKYAEYGAGPKVAWRRAHFEPWVHAIVGGAHVQPRVPDHGANALGFQTGGGLDYRINPRFSARLELDWISTHFWGEWQNSGQALLQGVIHF